MSPTMARVTIALLCLVLQGVTAARIWSFEHPGGLHTRAEYDAARNGSAAGEKGYVKAFEALMRRARRNLKRTPQPIPRFGPPPYYSNPKKNRAMHKDLRVDAWTAYSCAIAYRLGPRGQGTQYADKAVEVLDAWARKSQGCSNAEGDLLMTYTGIGFICAAEALSDYRGWKKEQRATFKQWVKRVHLRSSVKIAGRSNNWGDWGICGSIISHHFLGDKKGVDADIVRIRKKIDASISGDGRMPAETGRGNNGIWYTYFALAPLTAACRVAQNARGVDLFHFKGKDGAGIEKALDYLLKYCHAPRKWPHYKRKDLNLPRAKSWPGNLFEAMYGVYGKKEYEAWIKDARPIMVFSHHHAWSVPTLLRLKPPKRGSRK
jgi:hypothetical protein